MGGLWVATLPPEATRGPEGHSYTRGGFQAAMGRLTRARQRIGGAFGALFAEVMFSPEGTLTRHEREMIAGVSAAAQDCYY